MIAILIGGKYLMRMVIESSAAQNGVVRNITIFNTINKYFIPYSTYEARLREERIDDILND